MNMITKKETSPFGLKDKIGYLIGDGFIATAIKNRGIELCGKIGNTLSVFAAGDKAEGVTLSGLKYPLDNHTLMFNMPLGVSNSFLEKTAKISVKKGTLLIIWEENVKDFIDNL